jgi:gamma-D-glutamyl-L-lysine dipeptidyl-peptidase
VSTISTCISSFYKLLVFAVLLPAWSGLAQTALPSAAIAIPVANMFSAGNIDADVVSQAIYGTTVVVIEERLGWAKVRTPDQYTGWLRTGEVRQIALSEPPYATSGKTAQVSGLTANLYREPDVTAHQPLLMIPFESHLEITAEGQGDDDGWLQVRLVDGRLAWVQRGDVDLAPRKLTIDQSIALGRRFLGTTYTWAGTSSLGFDCSGFTQMLVRSRGILMPRDADLQAVWSGVDSLDRKRLRPGDLLFFGSSADHITHTGMFLGHGQFIHDTPYGHPGVQISRLRDQPWNRLLVACRRIRQKPPVEAD